MKHIVLAVAIFSLAVISFPSIGQQNKQAKQDKRDKIEAMRIAFITNKLELTPKEAQVFWPVYNEYTEKLKTLRKNKKNQFREVRSGGVDSLSNKEVEALIDGEMAFRQKELDIQKEYHTQFKSVLTVKKVAKLYMAEEAFKRELLKKLQEQKK